MIDEKKLRAQYMNRFYGMLAGTAMFSSILAFIPILAIIVIFGLNPLLSIFAIFVGVIAAYVTATKAVDVGLDLVDANEVEPDDEPRMSNLIDNLCLSAGVRPSPTLYRVSDDACNIGSFSDGKNVNAIVFTTGLIEQLSILEIEALVAAELLRIRTGESACNTLMLTTVGLPITLMDIYKNKPIAKIAEFFRVYSWKVIESFRPPVDQIYTDILATKLTRYPPGLSKALNRIDGHTVLEESSEVVAVCWNAPPTVRSLNIGGAVTHLALASRIDVLEEL